MAFGLQARLAEKQVDECGYSGRRKAFLGENPWEYAVEQAVHKARLFGM